mmetsp:Transcript_7877/g.12037  ORF Transcript_7877/g.12037 Transcript_7877/m.12037 type:complete len:111 (+) Transcript_7877:127-459(+)
MLFLALFHTTFHFFFVSPRIFKFDITNTTQRTKQNDGGGVPIKDEYFIQTLHSDNPVLFPTHHRVQIYSAEKEQKFVQKFSSYSKVHYTAVHNVSRVPLTGPTRESRERD